MSGRRERSTATADCAKTGRFGVAVSDGGRQFAGLREQSVDMLVESATVLLQRNASAGFWREENRNIASRLGPQGRPIEGTWACTIFGNCTENSPGSGPWLERKRPKTGSGRKPGGGGQIHWLDGGQEVDCDGAALVASDHVRDCWRSTGPPKD